MPKIGKRNGRRLRRRKTRARARPRSVVGADVSRSPAGCFCRGLLAVRGISRFRAGKFETFSLETAAGSDDYAIFVNRIDPISRNETTSSPPLPVGRRAPRCGADRRVRFRAQPARTTGAAARRHARRAARPRTTRPAAGDAVVRRRVRFYYLHLAVGGIREPRSRPDSLPRGLRLRGAARLRHDAPHDAPLLRARRQHRRRGVRRHPLRLDRQQCHARRRGVLAVVHRVAHPVPCRHVLRPRRRRDLLFRRRLFQPAAGRRSGARPALDLLPQGGRRHWSCPTRCSASCGRGAANGRASASVPKSGRSAVGICGGSYR